MPGFDAFISYSTTADRDLAAALQKGLEHLARPWNRRRALRVFRDDVNLPATPSLWPTLQDALSSSRFFVLLACPEAAASEWVGAEIEHFSTTAGAERILLVLTGGESRWDNATSDWDWSASTAIPSAVKGRLTSEPRFIDLRWTETAGPELLTLRHPPFRDAVGDLAAAIRGIARDELDAEDLRQFRIARRVRRTFAGLVAILALTSSAVTAIAVQQSRNADAKQRESRARELALLAIDDELRGTDVGSLLSLASLAIDETADGWRSLAVNLDEPAVELDAAALPADFSERMLAADASALLVLGDNGFQRLDPVRGDPLDAIALDLTGVAGDDAVREAVHSPDGRAVAVSAGAAGDVSVWDVTTGERIGTLLGAGPCTTLSYDATWAWCGPTVDDVFEVWEVRSGRRVGVVRSEGHTTETLGSVVFHRTEPEFVAAFTDGVAERWSLAGVPTMIARNQLDATGGTPNLALDGDVVVAAYGERLMSWSLTDGSVTKYDVSSIRHPIMVVAVSEPFGLIAASALFGELRMYRVGVVEPAVVLPDTAFTRELAFRNDVPELVIRAQGGLRRFGLNVFDARAVEPALGAILVRRQDAVAMLATGSQGVELFDPFTGVRWARRTADDTAPQPAYVTGDLAVLVDAGASIGEDDPSPRALEVVDLTSSDLRAHWRVDGPDGALQGTPCLFGDTVPTVTLDETPDPSVFVATPSGVVGRRLGDGTVVGPKLDVGLVGAIRIDPTGKVLASLTRFERIELWDTSSGMQIGETIPAPKIESQSGFEALAGCKVQAMAFSPDGTRIGVLDGDGDLRIFESATGREISTTERQTRNVSRDAPFSSRDAYASVFFAFSPDSERVVMASQREGSFVQEISVRRVDGLGEIASVPVVGVATARFVGDFVVFVDRDGSVEFRDAQTLESYGVRRAVNGLAQAGVGTFALSHDESTGSVVVAAYGAVATVTLPDRWRAEACQVVGRNLSPMEWELLAGATDPPIVCEY